MSLKGPEVLTLVIEKLFYRLLLFYSTDGRATQLLMPLDHF